MDPHPNHSDDEEEEEEDVRELKLPKVFTEDPQQTSALNNSMVALILQRYVDTKRGRDANFQLNPMLKLAMEYASRFAITKSTEVVQSIASMLDRHEQLDPFERAALANLCPEKAEEARALIPSIFTKSNLSEETVQEMLDEMAAFRDNQ